MGKEMSGRVTCAKGETAEDLIWMKTFRGSSSSKRENELGFLGPES